MGFRGVFRAALGAGLLLGCGGNVSKLIELEPAGGRGGVAMSGGGAGAALEPQGGGSAAVPCASGAACAENEFCAAQRCHLDALDVFAGESGTCVRLVDSSVRCFGNGFLGSVSVSAVPSELPLRSVFGVAMGRTSACALLLDGHVQCWGSGASGQLGNGELNEGNSEPVPVLRLDARVLMLRAGALFSCALQAGNALRCWGSNSFGQLGTAVPAAQSESALPVLLPEFSSFPKVMNLALGDSHACAFFEDGSVRCWGSNHSGQLGVPDVDSSNAPLLVKGLPEQVAVVAIAAGAEHTCAYLADLSLYCWGSNEFGQMGDGRVGTRFSPPGRVPGFPGPIVRGLLAGGDRTCVHLESGSALCWGDNALGGVGNGSLSAPQSSPVVVRGLPGAAGGVRALSLGARHSCALVDDGSVRCWGDNSLGQLGSTTTINYATVPTMVNGW